MAITFDIAYFLVWYLHLTLRTKLITPSIRLWGSCCARELLLRKGNAYLFIKRNYPAITCFKVSCWDISSASLPSEPAGTSVSFDVLRSRQMISLSCLWPTWKRADLVPSYRGSTWADFPQAPLKEPFSHRPAVFSFALLALQSWALLSFDTILGFSLHPHEIFVPRLPCWYFPHK